MKVPPLDAWCRIEPILERALDLAPESRAGYLEEACAGDERLRQEVERLLEADSTAGDFLSGVVGDIAGSFLQELDPTAEPRELAGGQTLGRYRIARRLGAGGMGEVYEALDPDLDRRVALKLLSPGLADDAERFERFEREAKAVAALNHPNIVTIHSVERSHGAPFFTMELVEGRTLDKRIPAGGMSLGSFLDLAVQLTDALRTAHEKGLTHRDLKPANIMVTRDGRLKILDFGLVKLSAAVSSASALEAETTPMTREGLVLGTLPYMSPEQAQGKSVDPRTDVFSLGIILYEMITGKRPFRGDTRAALVAAILRDAPRPPSELRRDLPATLEELILGCLEKRRERRTTSVRDLHDELERLRHRIEAERFIQPADGRPLDATPATGRRARLRAALGAALAALVLAGAMWLGRRTETPGPAAAGARSDDVPIAVLPFLNASDDEEDEYFSDGLTEELLTALVKVPGLRVAGRTSVFQFKGKAEDPRLIAEKLQVEVLLEGSVRKADQRIRITVELLNAEDGFQLWAHSYKRELDDIFAVQEEIARSVAKALEVSLLGREAPLVSAGADVKVYTVYLQGQYFAKRGNEEYLHKALRYYDEALAHDPTFAPAWAGKASAYRTLVGVGLLPVEEGYSQARRAVERALALDDTLAQAHVVVGRIRLGYNRDWAGAEAAFQRALALEPGNAEMILWVSNLACVRNRLEEAIALAQRALERDPLNPRIRAWLGDYLFRAGRYDEAAAAYAKALELYPERPYLHWRLGKLELVRFRPAAALREMELEPTDFGLVGRALAYHALGRAPEADAALVELIEGYSEVSAYQVAQVYAFRGEADRAFEWLERAYSHHDAGLQLIRGDPLFSSLADDPRWGAFLLKMGLVD